MSDQHWQGIAPRDHWTPAVWWTGPHLSRRVWETCAAIPESERRAVAETLTQVDARERAIRDERRRTWQREYRREWRARKHAEQAGTPAAEPYTPPSPARTPRPPAPTPPNPTEGRRRVAASPPPSPYIVREVDPVLARARARIAARRERLGRAGA